jgi:hypothetical protein
MYLQDLLIIYLKKLKLMDIDKNDKENQQILKKSNIHPTLTSPTN